MKLIEKLNLQYNSIAIIGLAKNAGKTVTLNYLIEEAYESGIKLGLTSTGRDGERVDIVTDTDKPAIYVTVDTLIATAKSLLDKGDARLEILESTAYTSPMGNIVICRVKEEGNIQLAGPSVADEIQKIKQKLIGYGADLVIIDGAIDRRAVSSPHITDACIVSTGAVLSRDIHKVVAQTAYYIKLMTLPEMTDKKLKTRLGETGKTCMIDENGNINCPNIKTGLGRVKTLTTLTSEDTRYIYISGAVTSSMLMDLANARHKLPLVIDDGTRIFSDYQNFNHVIRKGVKIFVLNPIKIEAITVNPISPLGYSFSSRELTTLLRAAIGDIPILDVLGGE
jgi:hypothetical protein